MNQSSNMKKILYILFTLMLALGAHSAHAQTNGDNYTLLEPLPCIEGTGNNCALNKPITEIDFNTYLGYVFKFGIAIAGFLAVVMIIVGGFEYMLSESFTSKSSAKDRIWNAIIGLLGVLTSYLILATIDPRLVQINSSLPKIEIKTEEIENFKNNLEGNINGLSTNSQIKYRELVSEQAQNQKKIDALQSKKGITPLSSQEEAELIALQENNKQLEAGKVKVLAHGEMDGKFISALTKINDAAKNVSREDIEKSVASEMSAIDATFAKLNPELTKNNDFEGSQDLEFRRTFLKKEIREQALIISALKDETWKPSIQNLEGSIAAYKKELEDLSNPFEVSGNRIKKNPELEAFQRNLLESRILLLEERVVKMKKK